MAPISRLAFCAVLLVADSVHGFHFPGPNSDSFGKDAAIQRRQATRAQVVERAQALVEHGLRRKRDQASLTPCPQGQTKAGDGTCCPTSQYASVQDECCGGAASVDKGKTCCADNYNPQLGCSGCTRGEAGTCKDGCCPRAQAMGEVCCRGQRGVQTSDGKCCPTDSVNTSTGKCDCQSIKEGPPSGSNTCVDEPAAVSRKRGTSPNPRSEHALHAREAAEYILNQGHFKRDGEWLSDRVHERDLGTSKMLARAASGVVNRMPPSWLSQRTRHFFSDPERLFPLSDSHNLLVGDLPEVLDLILEDPDFESVTFRRFRLGRPHLQAIRENIPFVVEGNRTVAAGERLNRRA